MQLRNNYDKNVFNGDLGYVTEVDTDEYKMSVRLDGKAVEYDRNQLDELSLAYATTIHKSQDSEYPVVVIPVTTSHYLMLQCNLIYTAVTRAKKMCMLVGTNNALRIAVETMNASKRNSKLKERLIT